MAAGLGLCIGGRGVRNMNIVHYVNDVRNTVIVHIMNNVQNMDSVRNVNNVRISVIVRKTDSVRILVYVLNMNTVRILNNILMELEGSLVLVLYTREERLEIGRKIYMGILSRFEAAVIYGISVDTARTYMRMYRDTFGLMPKDSGKYSTEIAIQGRKERFKRYKNMSYQQLLADLRGDGDNSCEP